MKKILLVTLTIFTLAFAGCKDETPNPDDEVKERSVPITLEISGTQGTTTFQNCTATVKGTLTLADINTYSTQLKTMIMGAYNFDTGNIWDNADNQDFYRSVFYKNDVTIILENTATSYTEIKTPDSKTMKIHINYLKSNPSDFPDKLLEAVKFMDWPGNFTP